MLLKLTRTAAAIVGVLALALAGAWPANAATGTVTPGAFCPKDKLGKFGWDAGGGKYVCEKRGDDKIGRWYPCPTPTVIPTATAGPTVTPTATAGPTATATVAPTASATGEPTPDPTVTAPTATPTTGSGGGGGDEQPSGGLPVTGAPVYAAVGVGAFLLAAGAGLLAVRRRRISFRAG